MKSNEISKCWLEYGLAIAIRHTKEELIQRGEPATFKPGYLQAMEDTLMTIQSNPPNRLVVTED